MKIFWEISKFIIITMIMLFLIIIFEEFMNKSEEVINDYSMGGDIYEGEELLYMKSNRFNEYNETLRIPDEFKRYAKVGRVPNRILNVFYNGSPNYQINNSDYFIEPMELDRIELKDMGININDNVLQGKEKNVIFQEFSDRENYMSWNLFNLILRLNCDDRVEYIDLERDSAGPGFIASIKLRCYYKPRELLFSGEKFIKDEDGLFIAPVIYEVTREQEDGCIKDEIIDYDEFEHSSKNYYYYKSDPGICRINYDDYYYDEEDDYDEGDEYSEEDDYDEEDDYEGGDEYSEEYDYEGGDEYSEEYDYYEEDDYSEGGYNNGNYGSYYTTFDEVYSQIYAELGLNTWDEIEDQFGNLIEY